MLGSLSARSLRNTNLTDATFSFDLGTLWNITKAIYELNPRNESLYHPYDNQSRICLKYDACVTYVGTSYTEYTTQDFWDIISAWRIPLIALIATTPLPALGFSSWIFAIVHMLADPIDTLWSLFYKLSLARRYEEWALDENSEGIFSLTGEETDSSITSTGTHTPQTLTQGDSAATIAGPSGGSNEQVDGATNHNQPRAPQSQADDNIRQDVPINIPQDEGPVNPGLKSQSTLLGGVGSLERDEREAAARRSHPEKFEKLDAKAVALIINAYDDWHFMELAKTSIRRGFRRELWSIEQRKNFRSSCNAAASLLAADRVAKFLPSVITSIVFFAQIAASFWKTLYNIGEFPDPSNPETVNLNRVPHNIAFGVLYFWLPFVIILTAFVGGPQTENSVPRILNIFRGDAIQIFQRDRTGKDYSSKDIKLKYLSYSLPERKQRLSTWHLDKFKDWNSTHAKFAIFGVVFSFIIVTIPAVAAVELSWRTPSEGFGCRVMTEILFWVSWNLRFLIDLTLVKIFREKNTSRDRADGDHGNARSMKIYKISWCLDFALVSGGIVVMTFVSIGLFNDCSCWSQWLTAHGDRYLSFPQEQYVFDTLRDRLTREFPIVVGGALALEAVLFVIMAVVFWKGYRVLRQDDIDTEIPEQSDEHTEPWRLADLGSPFSRCFAAIVKILPRRKTASLDTGKGKAVAQPELGKRESGPLLYLRHSRTSATERGESNEMATRRPASGTNQE
ncbi:hypothetical protein MMC11_002188 [Xylographa trunciseda]|nr:hypothetical protein [Xylographa trunciseda]